MPPEMIGVVGFMPYHFWKYTGPWHSSRSIM